MAILNEGGVLRAHTKPSATCGSRKKTTCWGHPGRKKGQAVTKPGHCQALLLSGGLSGGESAPVAGFLQVEDPEPVTAGFL
jgi:hypothetical protein